MNYWTNLWNSIIGKSYQKEIDKPLDVNRGANWQSAGGVRPTYSQGTALAAYGIHAYTHAAVSRISADLAALRLKLMRKDGVNNVEIFQHPVLDLLQNPSSDMTGYLFRAQLMTDLLLAGNCYILLLGSSDSNPVSILRLHPDEVKIVTDIQKGIIGYEHSSSGSVVMYPVERILHGKNVSYAKGSQQVYGCGATEALSREIDADLNSQKLASDASSKGRPDILLYPKEDGDIWPAETRRQILDNYTKMSKQGGALVLSGQCEIRELQLSPREMEFEASRRMARESISALLGCPPTVLGLPAANFATARQQSISYWTNQIKKGKQIAELFTKIAQLFDTSLYIEHDYTDVEALQSTRDAQLARIEKHILNGVSPEAAYQYEGLEFPRLKKEVEADINEDQENMRWIENIIRTYEDIEKSTDYGLKSNASEAMAALSENTQQALKKKGKEHNEEFGDNPKKKLTNVNYLAVSYHRGLAAYNSNPASVRPSVSSANQWAMGRVNGLLYALEKGRYRRSPFDTDLLPKDHPLSGAEKKHMLSGYKRLPFAQKMSDWGFTDKEADKIFDAGGFDLYRRAFLFVDKGGSDDKNAYRLPLAKMVGDELKVHFRAVVAAGSALRNEEKFRTGFYNLQGATDADRKKMYRVIQDLYEKFNEEAPLADWEEKSFVGVEKNMPILNEAYNPRMQSIEDIQASILGSPPNWERYADAHILVNPQRQQDKDGYLLLIARRQDPNDPDNAAPEQGDLVIYTDLMARAIDHLNGTEGRLPVTEEERQQAYDLIEHLYRDLDINPDPLLPAYLNSYELREITNFPTVGDDQKVSFRNSEYRVFDIEYAEDLKKNYPEIWRSGGNIKGNEQYRKLLPIAKRKSRSAESATEIKAMRLREAWSARHFRDGQQFKDPEQPINVSSVGGIVAQIKWLTVGNLGEGGMKKVINELKNKQDEKSIHTKSWQTFIEKQHTPTEKKLERISRKYLEESASRYADRAKKAVVKYYDGNLETRSILDWSTLYAINEEKRAFKQAYRIYWALTWQQSGIKALDDVLKKARKEDSDIKYKDNGSSEDALENAADQIVRARSAVVARIVQNGINEGMGIKQIAQSIEADTLFSAASAKRIATTEATRIINRAAIDAYNQASTLGINVMKQWLTAGDEKVRESHQEMNGQTVGPNELFMNDYGETFGPGEWADGSENINCRCTVVPVIE